LLSYIFNYLKLIDKSTFIELQALLNEFINLFKETAVVGYISVVDITMNSKSLQAVYYSVKPILFTGLVYYISVKLFSFIGKRLEMRLKEND